MHWYLLYLPVDELLPQTNSVVYNKTAEEVSPVIHISLLSEALDLMIQVDRITIAENSDAVVQLADCLEKLNSISQEMDRKNYSKLSSPVEEHIHTVYSLLNKFFDGKKLANL